MLSLLLVEDSRFFGSVIQKRLQAELGAEVTWVTTAGEARGALDAAKQPFFLAVLDLNLPDTTDGAIVDIVAGRGVPVVVLTAQISDEMRDRIWSRKVMDYIIKDGPQAVDYLLDLVRRISVNNRIKVLVVDDSVISRGLVTELLGIHRYVVLEASDGRHALDLLQVNPDIKLMITDYNMPGMDGFELVKQVRKMLPRDRLAVIGMSTYGSGHLSARFIKSGANDFLYKPFVAEEFYCRVAENVMALEQFRILEDLANKDHLTGLYNRRYFFAVGGKLFENALRSNLQLCMAMIDIDHFKKVNDAHGHETGDEVLRRVAQAIGKRFRASDIVARVGGEEFCVLTTNMAAQHARRIFEELCHFIGQMKIPHASGGELQATISIGLCLSPGANLEATMVQADRLLYQSKSEGRNRVTIGHYTEEACSR